jgi:hypothetical protein
MACKVSWRRLAQPPFRKVEASIADEPVDVSRALQRDVDVRRLSRMVIERAGLMRAVDIAPECPVAYRIGDGADADVQRDRGLNAREESRCGFG